MTTMTLLTFLVSTLGLSVDPPRIATGSSPEPLGLHQTGDREGHRDGVPLMIQRGDRLLFIGDDMTQQMFYTRAVAAAVIAMMPDAGLRFYNGGRDGSTAAAAMADVGDLLALTHPTVVFVSFGLNDGRARPSSPDASAIEDFRAHLFALVEKVKTHPGVREVVVIGPPAIQSGLNPHLDALGYHQTLRDISLAACEVAASAKVRCVGLYDHTKMMYEAANQVGGDPLTHGGWLPAEAAHVVIASVILRGIGMTAKQLEPLGWSPMRPVDMRRIRQVLALKVPPPDLSAAQLSSDLYESLRRCDERFFRLWRLTKRDESAGATPAQLASLEESWVHVQQIAGSYKLIRPNSGRD